MTRSYKQMVRIFCTGYLVLFFISPKYSTVRAQKKKNTCKGQSGAVTAVPPKMVPRQALHLKKDRERDKDGRAPVGISLCLSTSWF